MFYVCVVCMAKLRECLLLVCPECNQLLATMLEFRRTMHIGAKNLLFLYKNLRSKKQISPSEPEPSHELPAVIGDQSDQWLPVANEEVVQSDTTWPDVKAPPVASKTKPVELPPALPSRVINDALHVSEDNVDYAVLTPINEDTDLECKEQVVYSSELSETSPSETVEKIQKEFSSVSDSSKVDKIKLNRQLFEAIRVTLKSPSLTEEFDFKYEPESESESGRKTGPELAREWALELARESALKSELESESKSARELALESERELAPDSDSTVSGESDYDDPEHFPNIIFAKAFNGLAEQPREKDTGQGEKSQEHIHCHLVTNPPSEWPCTGEQCRLRSPDEEAPRTAGDSPSDTPVVRSKTKADVLGRPKCKLCARSFGKISMLWQHFERAHMDASLKCNVCRKEFRNETELTFHKMKHQFKKTVEYQFDALSRHACLECAVRCKCARVLRTHLRTRTHAAKMQWRFQCEICKRKCPDKQRMAEHIQREHLAKEAVKCTMCSASFRSARTLRRHVAKHIVESQAQTSKPTDTQTNGRARKRARATHTQGNENNDSVIQTNEQARKAPHVSKTSTAGHRPPPKSATMTGPAPASSGLPRPSPGHQSTSTATKRPRKTTNNDMYAYTNRRRSTHADANIKERDDVEMRTHGQTKKPRNNKANAYTKTQNTHTNPYDEQNVEIQINGQTNKKPRKTANKVNDDNRLTNKLIDTYDIEMQTNNPTRKLTNKKVTFANRQLKAHTDTYINDQDGIEMTDKLTRKTTNKKVNTHAKAHTDTYINDQDGIEMTDKLTRKTTNKKVNTHAKAHTDTYINDQDGIEMTDKLTRKTTNKKVNTHAKAHTDTYINDQDSIEKQKDGQTRKKPRKTTGNNQANMFTNKQEIMHTYIQESIPTAVTTHTHTNGRVRKRGKGRYVTSKRARTLAKATPDRERGAVAKASLFDMLSSFIL